MSESKRLLTDQWKTAGDCRFCRRKSYCGKQCSRNKQRLNAMVANYLDMELAKMYTKAVKEERNGTTDPV